jgi:hypothetical protein
LYTTYIAHEDDSISSRIFDALPRSWVKLGEPISHHSSPLPVWVVNSIPEDIWIETVTVLGDLSSLRGISDSAQDNGSHRQVYVNIPTPKDAHQALHSLSTVNRAFRAVTLPQLFRSVRMCTDASYFLADASSGHERALELAELHVTSLYLSPSISLKPSAFPFEKFPRLRSITLPIYLITVPSLTSLTNLLNLEFIDSDRHDYTSPKLECFKNDKIRHLTPKLQSLTIRMQRPQSPFWPILSQLGEHFNFEHLTYLCIKCPHEATLSSILARSFMLQTLILIRTPYQVIYDLPFPSLPHLDRLELRERTLESLDLPLVLRGSNKADAGTSCLDNLSTLRCPTFLLPFFDGCPLISLHLDEDKWDAEVVARELDIPIFPFITTLSLPGRIKSYLPMQRNFPELLQCMVLPDYRAPEPVMPTSAYTPGWF